jgi:crotonobetainyl-CoA:carnitine CoA-transferase CaiB-like acyl-CoA transferase
MTEKPLEGVKVADFCWALAGPRSTKILSDHGATVIKIESRSKKIDNQRVSPPFRDNIPGVNRSSIFGPYNTGKLSITLDLSQSKGIEVAKKLVAWADIVTNNFAGGAMERMGLGYEELKKIKSDIIMLSACMQGQTGPHAALPGFGGQLVALAGFRHIAGWPDRTPAGLEVYTDFITSHFAIPAIIAALLYRRRTGKGQNLDLSQYEGSLHFLTPLLLDYAVNERIATRMGNRVYNGAPHGAYRCRGLDRWCAIAVFTEEEWHSFCKVIGNPSWSKDIKFMNLRSRKENEDELDKVVEAWTVNRSPEEIMSMMQEAGVASGIVENVEDLIEKDPQLQHRNFFWRLPHPELGQYIAPGHPFQLSKTPVELRRAPLLGEHNEYVFREILGMSDDEIAELTIDGVVE